MIVHGWETLAATYLAYLAALGRPKTTLTLRRWQINHFASEAAAAPEAITEADILTFFAGHPWQPETRRSMRAAIRGFFGWAHHHGHIPDNPAAGLPQFRVPKAVARPCPETIYRQAMEDATPREQLMLRLAKEAGLRRAEIAQCHRRDVQFTAAGPVLLVHGKGAHERVVPITVALAAELAGSDGWCFPSSRGGHLTPRSVGVMCSDLLGPDVTLHQLRHSFATNAYRGSRNLPAVQKLLGHSNLAVTERYLQTDDDELRAAMMHAVVA
jgi:integrase